MNHRLARVDGTIVEFLGRIWVAYSPATGETVLLNNESAAILEILESGCASPVEVCSQLSADSGIPVEELLSVVEASWPRLIEAGFVRSSCDSPRVAA